MRVTIPKNERIQDMLEFRFYKRVEESEETVTYEGAFPFSIYFKDYNIPKGERQNFYRNTEVDGGFKAKYKDRIDISPRREETILLKVSKELRELIDKYVEEHETTISDFLRTEIIEAITRWLRAKREAEESRRTREKHAGQRERDEERIYG